VHESIATTPEFDAADPESVRARNERVMANRGLVVSIARTLDCDHVPLEDLIQFGYLGLITAAERFDPGRGIKFGTYATYWIRREMYEGMMNTSREIRVPKHAWQKAQEVERCIREMGETSGTPPSVSEAVAMMDIPGQASRVETYRWATESIRQTFAPVPLFDAFAVPARDEAGDSAAMVTEEWEQIARALPLLPENHRRLLALHYGLDGQSPLDMKQTARRMRVSKQTAHEWRRIALDRLRKLLNR
jgi:RNA polymerase primary sigma factor